MKTDTIFSILNEIAYQGIETGMWTTDKLNNDYSSAEYFGTNEDITLPSGCYISVYTHNEDEYPRLEELATYVLTMGDNEKLYLFKVCEVD